MCTYIYMCMCMYMRVWMLLAYIALLNNSCDKLRHISLHNGQLLLTHNATVSSRQHHVLLYNITQELSGMFVAISGRHVHVCTSARTSCMCPVLELNSNMYMYGHRIESYARLIPRHCVINTFRSFSDCANDVFNRYTQTNYCYTAMPIKP